MREAYGNLWDFRDQGFWICVTTNGDVNRHGFAVMGKGVAAQAKTRMPELPAKLALRIKALGNHVHRFDTFRVFSFPVKHHWSQKADLGLIQRSCDELMARLDRQNAVSIKRLYLPRPGCGNGGLDWHHVRDAIYERLDDRVIVITNGPRT
jgi:hypothetical protein